MDKKTYIFIAAGLILAISGWLIQDHFTGQSDSKTQVTMYKNPGCQCCTKWASHLEASDFRVTERPVDRLPIIKAEHGVPYNLNACHTALIEGYVVEGHVPAGDIQRLLKEKPEAAGLAVPGMPVGSPGMEGTYSEPYQVYLFKENGDRTVFSKY